MTSLALGIVGAAVGSLFGMPQLGFLIGSMVGSLLDPPKTRGPRLSDLKLQTSTYGKPIPFVWGTMRIAGNMIDQTDLEEHEHHSSGKGGAQNQTFTYTSSFAIALCQAAVFGQPAIRGVLRVWADGRLWWSQDDGTEFPFTLYYGTEDQSPDPTFEAIHGVGEVPAYRGIAYVVATDLDLSEFYNRIPSFEFEVFTAAGDYPYWIAHGKPWTTLGRTPPSFVINADGDLVVLTTDGTVNCYYSVYDVDTLTPIGTETLSTTSFARYGNACNSLFAPSQGGGVYQWTTADMLTGTMVDGSDVSSTAPFVPSTFQGNEAVAINTGTTGAGYYSMSGVSAGLAYVNKYYEGGSYVSAYGLGGTYVAGDCSLGVDAENEKVWVLYNGTGPNQAELWRFDADLNLEKHWTHAELAGTLLTSGGGQNFVVYRGQICFQQLNGGSYYATLIDVDPTSDALTDSTIAPFLLDASGRFAYLGSGRVVVQGGGIFGLNPPADAANLATIVGNLCDMTPAAGDYDVTELEDDTVRGFVVASQMTVRNALQALRQAFFFDAVESDDEIVFRKRSETVAFTIPDGELCGRAYGEPSGDPLKTTRQREQETPRQIAVTHIDYTLDYQTGVQIAHRQTTLSEQDVSVEVPIVLTSDEAKQIAETLLTASVLERETFEWSTTRKWAHLEPCDVGNVRGRVIRIQTRTEQPNGVIKFTGTLAAPSIYTNPESSIYVQPADKGTPDDGWIPPDPPGPKAATTLVLLDTPLLHEDDFSNGIYAAVRRTAAGSWTGTGIFKSADGGSTYASVADVTSENVIGTVATAVGDFAGGNIFDELNWVDVVVVTLGGELASASRLGVKNGANACLVGSAANGWEVIQFRTATLTAPNTYRLTGLLRGRRGTEWTIANHQANEVFILLPAANINAPSGEVGASRKYKAVTYGTAIASVTAQDFTNTAIARKCYSPSHFGGGRDDVGNLLLYWKRRTRIGGAWLNGADVPLSEAAEYYRVFYYPDATYTPGAHVRETYVPAAQSTIYLASEQTADFGSPQLPVYAEVVQGGFYGNGYSTQIAI